jgi:hypothetical protein
MPNMERHPTSRRSRKCWKSGPACRCAARTPSLRGGMA